MKRSRSVGGAQRCLMDHDREGLAARWGRGPSWRLQRAMDMGVLPTARHGDGGAAAGGGGKALSGDAHGDRACSAVWWLRPCRSAAELLPVAIGGLNNNGGCIKREKNTSKLPDYGLEEGDGLLAAALPQGSRRRLPLPSRACPAELVRTGTG
jgi:hypothetical protein